MLLLLFSLFCKVQVSHCLVYTIIGFVKVSVVWHCRSLRNTNGHCAKHSYSKGVSNDTPPKSLPNQWQYMKSLQNMCQSQNKTNKNKLHNITKYRTSQDSVVSKSLLSLLSLFSKRLCWFCSFVNVAFFVVFVRYKCCIMFLYNRWFRQGFGGVTLPKP